tara:strand:- start:2299 stop:2667 length:369 start_codon:yes stop_codon:yes gene_type:complete
MVHQITKAVGLLCFWGIVSTSCYYDNEEDLYPQSFECDTTAITYDGKVGAIINQNCATSGCHDGISGAISLTNYGAVKAIVDNGKLENRVLISRDMPPTGNLTYCEYQQLEIWLSKGAPETE